MDYSICSCKYCFKECYQRSREFKYTMFRKTKVHADDQRCLVGLRASHFVGLMDEFLNATTSR